MAADEEVSPLLDWRRFLFILQGIRAAFVLDPTLVDPGPFALWETSTFLCRSNKWGAPQCAVRPTVQQTGSSPVQRTFLARQHPQANFFPIRGCGARSDRFMVMTKVCLWEGQREERGTRGLD